MLLLLTGSELVLVALLLGLELNTVCVQAEFSVVSDCL